MMNKSSVIVFNFAEYNSDDDDETAKWVKCIVGFFLSSKCCDLSCIRKKKHMFFFTDTEIGKTTSYKKKSLKKNNKF